MLLELTRVDDKVNAAPHDFGFDGLGEEVRGTSIERVYLGGGHAVCRDDDNGNIRNGGIRLLLGEHVEAGLSGHVQIEQHSVNALLAALAHDVEGIATIVRFEDVVLGSEDSTHLYTIDYRVVCNKNSLIVHGHSVPTRTARAMIS